MKVFLSAVLLVCFASAFGRELSCTSNAPTEKRIDGLIEIQPDDIQMNIEKALSNDPNVKLSVDALIAERALKSPEEKFASSYTDTCPRTVNYITSLIIQSQKCYVIYPKLQRVTSVVCKTRSCYGFSTTVGSRCVRTGWTRLQFWVWCPTCGFKLVARWYPQCCSCYRWKLCDLQQIEREEFEDL